MAVWEHYNQRKKIKYDYQNCTHPAPQSQKILGETLYKAALALALLLTKYLLKNTTIQLCCHAEKGLPIQCSSLIQVVGGQPHLCEDVCTVVSDFPLLNEPVSHSIHLILLQLDISQMKAW